MLPSLLRASSDAPALTSATAAAYVQENASQHGSITHQQFQTWIDAGRYSPIKFKAPHHHMQLEIRERLCYTILK